MTLDIKKIFYGGPQMRLLSSSEFQKYLNHMFEIIEVQAYLVQMSMSEAQAKEGALWNS